MPILEYYQYRQNYLLYDGEKPVVDNKIIYYVLATSRW